MMVLLDGEPSGKAGSPCKRFLRALILLFISVCNMWVRIRALAMGRLSVSSIIKGQRYLVFSPPWKPPGHDMDPTQRVQLLVGLPYGSRSYPKPFAHALDVIRDCRILACPLLPREAFCLCIEQVDGHRAQDERRVRGVEHA